jgi:hypothetical protein
MKISVEQLRKIIVEQLPSATGVVAAVQPEITDAIQTAQQRAAAELPNAKLNLAQLNQILAIIRGKPE